MSWSKWKLCVIHFKAHYEECERERERERERQRGKESRWGCAHVTVNNLINRTGAQFLGFLPKKLLSPPDLPAHLTDQPCMRSQQLALGAFLEVHLGCLRNFETVVLFLPLKVSVRIPRPLLIESTHTKYYLCLLRTRWRPEKVETKGLRE